jgi:hypothetical protein
MFYDLRATILVFCDIPMLNSKVMALRLDRISMIIMLYDDRISTTRLHDLNSLNRRKEFTKPMSNKIYLV